MKFFRRTSDARREFNAVLPLAVRGGKESQDLVRAQTLLRSLRAGFERSQRLVVHVVGRPAELADIRAALEPLDCDWLAVRFHDEHALLPELAASGLNGWFKQQLVKLSTPEWLDCPAWLTLDADVVCVRRFAIEDLMPEGRALVQFVSLKGSPLYKAWAASSAEMLGIPDAERDRERMMAMTPVLYVRDVMLGMHRELERVSGRPWRQALLETPVNDRRLDGLFAGWAEMALYQLHADRHGLWPQHHSVNGLHTDDRLLTDGSIWGASQVEPWTPDEAFRHRTPGYFIVCGSHTGIDAVRVRDLVEPHVETLALAHRQPVPPHPSSSGVSPDDTMHFARRLSADPLIYYSVPVRDAPIGIAPMVSPLLAGTRVFFLVGLWWAYDDEKDVRTLVETYRRWQPLYPNHSLTVLCNTQAQVNLLSRAGVSCILCHQNMFVDEAVFRRDSGESRRFDAVYNAGLVPFKRHLLARDIPSLAFIYGSWHGAEADYPRLLREAMPQALFVNDAVQPGRYSLLDPETCARWYSRAHVGLCLSEVEGAMYASMEYLMCGLPVVSTPSRGGRDYFFDSDIVAIAEPEAAAVAEAVRRLIERRLPPEQVREHVLEKVRAERRKFMALLEFIHGSVGRPFRGEALWREFFAHKLIEPVLAGDLPQFIFGGRK
ncbi:MAG: DUF6492 family protein [Reyranellaceae bacterium]